MSRVFDILIYFSQNLLPADLYPHCSLKDASIQIIGAPCKKDGPGLLPYV